MDSQGNNAEAEAAQLALIQAHLFEVIKGLTKLGKHLPAAHAQMAFDILEQSASKSDQS